MRSLGGAAVLLWLGVMAFFAFVVAPAAFGTLEREAAGRFVSAVFPRYYLAGAVLGAVALAVLLWRALVSGWRGWDWLSLLLIVLMLAGTLYAWVVVLPAAHAAREAMREAAQGPPLSTAATAFARLHRLSGILNGAVMVAGFLFVIVEAVRR